MPTEAHELDNLDPDDPRPPSQGIANILRAAIKTGRYGPGEKLLSQNELADRYGVARETVKDALRFLIDERLVVSRQGSGTFVRVQTERPVGLRPHIEVAFERPHVSIDFAGFTGETLHGALSEPLDKIRAGKLTPESMHVRMLLPDLTASMAIPGRADDGDSAAIRQRQARISARSVEGIRDAVNELVELDLIKSGKVEVRVFATSPTFKLYVLNSEEAFFGFYPVARHRVTIEGQHVSIFDAMGKDATLFQFTSEDADSYRDYVTQAKNWFDSVWSTIAHELRL